MIFFLFFLQLSFQLKVGILFCRAGQSTEEEMYNNETGSPALDQFLDLLGHKVQLKGFTKHRAQQDTTGTKKLPVFETEPLPVLILFQSLNEPHLSCSDVIVMSLLMVGKVYVRCGHVVVTSAAPPVLHQVNCCCLLPVCCLFPVR